MGIFNINGLTYLDGGTGTNLEAAGLPNGVCVEKWIADNPAAMETLQKRYIEAGSQIIYAPTFGLNYGIFSKYGKEEEIPEYVSKLVALSRRVADGKALVAGDMSPTGKLARPYGDYSLSKISSLYEAQAEALSKSDVDLFVLETLSSLGEAVAAFDTVRMFSDKEIIVTFTVEKNGRTLAGDTPLSCLLTMQARGASAFGFNCGYGFDGLADIISEISPYSQIPIIVKPNAGLPVTVDGKQTYSLSAELFGESCKELVEAGASVLGGCCGTTPDHIASLVRSTSDIKLSVRNKKYRRYAVTPREVFEITADMRVSETFPCDSTLMFNMPEKDEADIFSVFADENSDFDSLTDVSLYLEQPLMLDASSVEILEKALRAFPGVCLFNGKSSLPSEDVEKLCKRYGMSVFG